jgi:hypothetical protein
MFDVLADFEWFRNRKGYRLEPASALNPRWRALKGKSRDVPWVVPNGAPRDEVRYRPFARGGDLCAAFAAIRSPNELLRFINAHGPLTWHGTVRPSIPDLENLPAGEPVTVGLAEAEMFRELLTLHALGDSKKTALHFETIAGFVGGGQAGRVEILPDHERGIRLKVTPPTLLGAMWYQLALKLSQAVLRMCPLCHRVFEVGPGTKLRADAKFCCNEHKVEFFNRSRVKKGRGSRRDT